MPRRRIGQEGLLEAPPKRSPPDEVAELIAGRLALEHGRTIISHESICRLVYRRSAQKDCSYHFRLIGSE